MSNGKNAAALGIVEAIRDAVEPAARFGALAIFHATRTRFKYESPG